MYIYIKFWIYRGPVKFGITRFDCSFSVLSNSISTNSPL